MKRDALNIAMLSIHSSPVGELGTRDTGGMSVYIRELAKELGRRGHRVDIYSQAYRHPHGQEQTVFQLHENVRLIHLTADGTGPLTKLALYPRLEMLFEGLEAYKRKEGRHYDIVHSHYWLSGRLGHWAQSRWKRPHFVMFHTLGAVKNSIGVGPPEPDLRIENEKHLVASSHRILVATDKEKNLLATHYDANPDKIGVVPCGVNLDLFQPMDRSSVRRNLGFDDHASIILYVGRFDPVKGIERLLKAVAHLEQPGANLVIVGGDGPDTPEMRNLEQLSRKHGVRDRVMFTGRIAHEDLPSYYNAADVLVIPSYYESFGLVGLEAMACGTPVVSTRVGVLESLLKDGVNGRIVSNGNPQALAKSIKTVIHRKGRDPASPSIETIRASVEAFRWSSVASRILEEYETAHRSSSFM